MKKSIRLEEVTWEKLMLIKISSKSSSISNVIDVIIQVYEKAIEKEDPIQKNNISNFLTTPPIMTKIDETKISKESKKIMKDIDYITTSTKTKADTDPYPLKYLHKMLK